MFLVKICHDGQLLSFLNSYFVNGYAKSHSKTAKIVEITAKIAVIKDQCCWPEYRLAVVTDKNDADVRFFPCVLSESGIEWSHKRQWKWFLFPLHYRWFLLRVTVSRIWRKITRWVASDRSRVPNFGKGVLLRFSCLEKRQRYAPVLCLVIFWFPISGRGSPDAFPNVQLRFRPRRRIVFCQTTSRYKSHTLSHLYRSQLKNPPQCFVGVRFPMKGSSFATTSNMGKRTRVRENSIGRGIRGQSFFPLASYTWSLLSAHHSWRGMIYLGFHWNV